ncbi:MAG: hypothetical protein AAF497_01370 [Planctomycetota bacterium]
MRFALACFVLVQCIAVAQAEFVEAINAKWKARDVSLKSLDVALAIDWIDEGKLKKAAEHDVFAPLDTSRETFRFLLSNGKCAYQYDAIEKGSPISRQSGKNDSGDEAPMTVRYIKTKQRFNGSILKTSVDGGFGRPIGQEMIGENQGSDLLKTSHCQSILIAYSPIRAITLLGYDPKKLVASDKQYEVDGVSHIRLRVPGQIEMLVQPETGLVSRWIRISSKGRSVDTRFEYDKLELVRFEQRRISRNQSQSRMVATATLARRNPPIDNSRFKLEFEVGTHFKRQEPDRKNVYFEQTVEGRKPISKSKFGRLPKDSPWREK